MIAVVQRVTNASVEIENKMYSSIQNGFLVLLGVKNDDYENNAILLAKKIAELRILEDSNGKMNLSLKDVNGELLIISQFTLCTDNSKSGNRPSFTFAAEPEKAKILYLRFINEIEKYYEKSKVKTGVFAADMKVNLTNDGPVTIILEK